MTWTSPWLLAALLLLPLLWWLMRLLPPAPQVQRFPAIALLSARTARSAQHKLPWWLLLLRLLLAALIMIGLAGPVWRAAGGPPPAARQTLVIDTGWTAAGRFAALKDLAGKAIEATAGSGTRYRIIATADTRSAATRASQEWLTPSLARQRLQALEPQAWRGDRDAITMLKAAGDLQFISDGLEPQSAARLIRWGAQGGRVFVREAVRRSPVQIKSVQMTNSGLAVAAVKATDAYAGTHSIRALDSAGRTLSLAMLSFAKDKTSARTLLPVAPGARVHVAHLKIDDEASSAGVHLLDRRQARAYVGISSRDGDAMRPLQSANYYLSRALAPHADIARGDVATMLKRGVNLLILPDMLPETSAARAALQNWVTRGGVILLFAGPRSSDLANPLLPVALRPTARDLGGGMSWGKAAALGPWPKASPFAGLPVPKDVAIRQQWLSEPTLNSAAQSWATLSDATPLVSAAPRGRGLIILVHTTADPAWSNLVLSGLFEQMLLRILPFTALPDARQGAGTNSYQLADAVRGDGSIEPAAKNITLTAATLRSVRRVSAAAPPGRYISGNDAIILNNDDTMPGWIGRYAGAQTISDQQARSERFAAAPWLFSLAALLFLIDMAATLILKGLVKRPALPAFAALLLGGMIVFPVHHAEAAPAGASDVQLCALREANAEDSLAGLQNLAQALKMRTAIQAGEPILVDRNSGQLGLCSLLYWPVRSTTAPLSEALAARLRRYMQHGGLLLIDAEPGMMGSAALRQLLAPLALPQLEALATQHVLAKAFYLLERAPGGFDFAALWLESGTRGADGRTSEIILTSSNWAAQWRNGNDRLAQERALRFGINAIIYALTGTYKADQVHAAGLLDRLNRPPR